MKIDNEFTVSVPIERAWEVLTDLEGIAPCLPGAQLTGVDGDVYAGKVKIKVGPVVSDYSGTARFAEKDDHAYHAVIDAKGKDSRGNGNAAARIDAQLRADGSRTVVTVNTDLNISGKIAQFGAGMIKEVSAKLLGQFVQNLETRLLAPTGTAEAVGATGAEPDGPTATLTRTPVGPPAEPPGGTREKTPAVAPGPDAVAANGGSITRGVAPAAEPEPLDLMSLAGGSVCKRALALVGGIAAVALVVASVLCRRASRH